MTRSAAHILAELLGVPYAEKRELLDEFVEVLMPSKTNGKSEFWQDVAKASEVVGNMPAWKRGDLGKPIAQPGDRVGPDDVGVGDVVREQTLGDCCDTRLTRRDEAGNWHGVVVYSSDTEWIAEGMGNAVAFVSRAVTLVSRAEPDVDAVLAPLRALESVLRDRSVAKNEYSIQAMDAYAETVNLLSDAIAKAREAAT